MTKIDLTPNSDNEKIGILESNWWLPFCYDDGGREAAGYKGKVGDCLIRAIAIVTGNPYREVYRAIYRLGIEYATTCDDELALEMRSAIESRHYHLGEHPTPRTGVNEQIAADYLREFGWYLYHVLPDKNGEPFFFFEDLHGCEGRYIINIDYVHLDVLRKFTGGHSIAIVDGQTRDVFDSDEFHPIPVRSYFAKHGSPIQKIATPPYILDLLEAETAKTLR
jgi:hypothetical protein